MEAKYPFGCPNPFAKSAQVLGRRDCSLASKNASSSLIPILTSVLHHLFHQARVYLLLVECCSVLDCCVHADIVWMVYLYFYSTEDPRRHKFTRTNFLIGFLQGPWTKAGGLEWMDHSVPYALPRTNRPLRLLHPI
jgi:hypothetical protein